MLTFTLALLTLVVSLALGLLAGAEVMLWSPFSETTSSGLAAAAALALALAVPLAVAARVHRSSKWVHRARATLATAFAVNLLQLLALGVVLAPSLGEAMSRHGGWAVPRAARPIADATLQELGRAVASRRRAPSAVSTSTAITSDFAPVTALVGEAPVPELAPPVREPAPPAAAPTLEEPSVISPSAPKRLDAREIFTLRADAVVLVEAQRKSVYAEKRARAGHRARAPRTFTFWSDLSGSGFLISADGLFVTNHHVLGDAGRATVTLRDGRRFEGVEVLARDPTHDLVLARLDGTGLPFAPLSAREAEAGEPSFAIGNPLGLNFSITQGILSAEREFHGTKCWQMQTDIAPGSSGGPLFDQHGEVIGVNTMGRGGGLNIAVKVEHVHQLLERERTSERLEPAREGLRVTQLVVEGRPATPAERLSIAAKVQAVVSAMARCMQVLPRDAEIQLQLSPFELTGSLHPQDLACLRRERDFAEAGQFILGWEMGEARLGRVEAQLEGVELRSDEAAPPSGLSAKERSLRFVVEHKAPAPTAAEPQ